MHNQKKSKLCSAIVNCPKDKDWMNSTVKEKYKYYRYYMIKARSIHTLRAVMS